MSWHCLKVLFVHTTKLYTLLMIHSVILERRMEDGMIHRQVFSAAHNSILSTEDINTHVLKVEMKLTMKVNFYFT